MTALAMHINALTVIASILRFPEEGGIAMRAPSDTQLDHVDVLKTAVRHTIIKHELSGAYPRRLALWITTLSMDIRITLRKVPRPDLRHSDDERKDYEDGAFRELTDVLRTVNKTRQLAAKAARNQADRNASRAMKSGMPF